MLFSYGLILGLVTLVLTAPAGEKRQLPLPDPIVRIPQGAVVGLSISGVDSFKGIPFAKPPVGQLRLKPPQALPANPSPSTIPYTAYPRACPQFSSSLNTTSLPDDTLSKLLDPVVTNSGEDCLTLNIQRPSTATVGSNLPVLFWIFGGGFESGSTQSYDATQLILNSILNEKEILYVAVNYRLGGFGFLPGREIRMDRSANLGLLDQRMALQWVADNIYNFGGSPSKVTLWGESAGSISVFDQMALFNGRNFYKGNSLFRAAIMDSGSIVPADPVDCGKSQIVYNTVVQNAGCASATDTLACLRTVNYETFLNAANSVPSINSYQSIALSYLPRPDYITLTHSPDILAQNGQYTKIPVIIGDQEDEGTVFSLSQSNIATTAQLVQYFQDFFFHDATLSQIQTLVSFYPDDPSAGSPFGTGPSNNIYPQYKRLAALLGDISFTLTRRILLSLTSAVAPAVPSWSYLASYDYGFPVLGTFHSSDIQPAYGQQPGEPSASIQAYYLNFINKLNPNPINPNVSAASMLYWPQWSQGNMLMNFNAASNVLIPDTFRPEAYNFIKAAGAAFYV